jgi:cell wall-associated NlpC family hydrolase
MRHSRRAAGLLIAFVVALGTASPPAKATSVSIDKLTAAQDNLIGLETGASLSSLSLVLDARDADDYLHGIQQTQRVVVNGEEVLAHADAANTQAGAAQQHAAAARDALTAAKNLVTQSTAEATNAVAAAARDLAALGIQLGKLLQQTSAPTSGELLEIPNRTTDTDPDTAPNAPPRPYRPNVANRALNFALAQIGKPYTWGGTGPRSFDCSGLAMRAYEAAGIRLPHFAAFQYAASHPLTRSQLKPGDLLFWATNQRRPATIYHEALYLGNGLMVQAPKTHWRISVASMWMWGPIQFYARPY